MSDERRQPALAIVGLGKLGATLLRGFLDRELVPPERVRATVKHEARVRELAEGFGVAVSTNNRAAVAGADVVLVCVKPHAVLEVCREFAPALAAEALVISVAAGVSTSQIEEVLGEAAVVRAMPNTPAVIGCGMTGLAAGRRASPAQLERARRLFEAVGRAVVLDEQHMDAVTGLSASGPAFVYVILESLAEGGVKVGLPREISTELAAQATLGAAAMVLESGSHPALLKDAVTTPAGCTIDGLLELEEGGVRVTLIKAVVEAARRAGELAAGRPPGAGG